MLLVICCLLPVCSSPTVFAASGVSLVPMYSFVHPDGLQILTGIGQRWNYPPPATSDWPPDLGVFLRCSRRNEQRAKYQENTFNAELNCRRPSQPQPTLSQRCHTLTHPSIWLARLRVFLLYSRQTRSRPSFHTLRSDMSTAARPILLGRARPIPVGWECARAIALRRSRTVTHCPACVAGFEGGIGHPFLPHSTGENSFLSVMGRYMHWVLTRAMRGFRESCYYNALSATPNSQCNSNVIAWRQLRLSDAIFCVFYVVVLRCLLLEASREDFISYISM